MSDDTVVCIQCWSVVDMVVPITVEGVVMMLLEPCGHVEPVETTHEAQ